MRLCVRRSIKPKDDNSDGYYESYKGFANTLRAWLVAYGIGAPVLIVSQESVWTKLATSPLTKPIIFVFLFGIVLQVGHAALYKWAQWELYSREGDEDAKSLNSYKIADYVSEEYGIDAIVDIGSIAFYAIGTVLMLIVMTANPNPTPEDFRDTAVPIVIPS